MIDKSSIYDVIVIGGGPGGYVAAIRAAQLKLKTAVIERDRLGGVCLNWGCIPSKALLESARLFDEMKRAAEFGLICSDPQPDWDKLIKRSRGVADQMSNGVGFLMKKNKIDVYSGSASLASSNRIEVGSGSDKQILETKNIILATGAHPRPLPGMEFDGKNIIDSTGAMTFPKQPKSMLIIGAGAIGCEFAWFYNTMGTQVTLVELLDQILPIEDKDVSTVVSRSFVKHGMTVYTGSKVTDVKKGKGNWKYTIELPKGKKAEVEAEVCLVAVGVQANLGFGEDKAGLITEHGFFKVDDHMRTNIPNIFAIGDCAGAPLLAHAASHEGICAVESIAGLNPVGISHHNVPGCTYCHPQVGSVGMTEQKAKDAGHKVKTGKYLFRANGRAVAGGETDGFVKFVIDEEFGEVLGVHIVGPGAPELIGEIVLGRELELTVHDFAHTIHAHPTLSEAVMEAAGDALGEAIHI